MTTQEMIEQVFQESGEPSDRCPYTTPGDETTFDITTTGAVKLLRELNKALIRIANWVFPDGGYLRLRGMMCKAYFQSKAPVVDTASAGTATTVRMPGLANNVVDQYRGWVVEITAGTGVGQKRLILSNTVEVAADIICTVHSAWDTNPDNTSVLALYKNFFQFVGAGTAPYQTYHIALDPVATIQDIIKIRDLESMSDLTPTDRVEVFTANILQPGIPTSYKIMGNQILFDSPIDTARSYEMLYIKQPQELVSATQVPDIPLQYHEAITMWATHNIQRLNSDFDGAYATKREMIDLMGTLRQQGASDMDLENGGVTVYG